MEIIDTHCHLDVEAFDRDRETIIERCKSKGISKLVIPAIKSETWGQLDTLCQEHNALFAAFGLHPMFISEHNDDDLSKLSKKLQNADAVAVGEIGLDFYMPLTGAEKQKQLDLFSAQLEIASELDLPVILHVRKAHDQVLQLLKKYKVKGGFSHAYNGSEQQAMKYIELGFKLGFGGTLTYPNANKIHKLAMNLPLESIVLETDAPDMVVATHRGERNSPEYITESLSKLAELRGMAVEEVARQTSLNARQIIPAL